MGNNVSNMPYLENETIQEKEEIIEVPQTVSVERFEDITIHEIYPEESEYEYEYEYSYDSDEYSELEYSSEISTSISQQGSSSDDDSSELEIVHDRTIESTSDSYLSESEEFGIKRSYTLSGFSTEDEWNEIMDEVNRTLKNFGDSINRPSAPIPESSSDDSLPPLISFDSTDFTDSSPLPLPQLVYKPVALKPSKLKLYTIIEESSDEEEVEPFLDFRERVKIRAQNSGKSFDTCKTELRAERNQRIQSRVIYMVSELNSKQKLALRVLLENTQTFSGYFRRNPLVMEEAKSVLDLILKYKQILLSLLEDNLIYLE